MRIKADPTESLHCLKRREIGAVFGNCPKKLFRKTLELGAGDGYQSTLLAEYTEELICTDLNPRRLKRTDGPNVLFRIVDAENAGEHFNRGEFDMVFSSSLLEHLPDPGRALAGMHKILRDDGIGVHLMPNRLWKITTVLLHIPNRLVTVVDRFLGGVTFSRASRRSRGQTKETYGGNNLKVARRKQSRLIRPFLPRIHGVSTGTFAEFLAFGRQRWVREFEAAGFEVLAITRITFSSGYGFGFERLRRLIEKCGCYTVLAYVVCKKGHTSRVAQHLTH
jgi:SAM-dependent methyltransferase